MAIGIPATNASRLDHEPHATLLPTRHTPPQAPSGSTVCLKSQPNTLTMPKRGMSQANNFETSAVYSHFLI